VGNRAHAPTYRDGGEEVHLEGLRAEFRPALRDEIDAARRAASSSVIALAEGHRLRTAAGAFQYRFWAESALNLPRTLRAI
jgi:hypothetical protein